MLTFSRVCMISGCIFALVACVQTTPGPDRAYPSPSSLPALARTYPSPSSLSGSNRAYPPPTVEGYPAPSGSLQAASTSTLPPESTPAPFPAPDFGLIFTYSSCLTNSLDTFTQIYTKGITEDATVTATVRLSAADIGRMYEQMIVSHYFEYPSYYETPVPPEDRVTASTPAPRYTFQVHNDGRWKRVEWVDNFYGSKTLEAERLGALARLINIVIQAQPVVKALPQSNVGCA